MTDDVVAGPLLYVADLDRLAAFYATVLGFLERGRDADHVVLESRGFQLVLLQRDPSTIAASRGTLGRRSEVAIKPVFVVPSIEAAREAASAAGGVVNARRHEWRFGQHRVCDALDPEGNVIQLRERIGVPGARSGS
jgi:predicted enzyme related to lactoylglutathione lyase